MDSKQLLTAPTMKVCVVESCYHDLDIEDFQILESISGPLLVNPLCSFVSIGSVDGLTTVRAVLHGLSGPEALQQVHDAVMGGVFNAKFVRATVTFEEEEEVDNE